jgi:hypothetical protein
VVRNSGAFTVPISRFSSPYGLICAGVLNAARLLTFSMQVVVDAPASAVQRPCSGR